MLGRFFALAACALPLTSALPKIHAKGKYLYDESGNRFYIKGVAYQEAGELGRRPRQIQPTEAIPSPALTLTRTSFSAAFHPSACNRDLPYLKQLGVNAVRIYSVNSQLNHDDCMAALDSAGIYTIIDLSLPLNGSINRAAPSWTTSLQSLYTDTIDAFAKYNNVLSFNVANEVINLANNTHTAPFIKAAARDIKAYLKSKGSSALVGYSTVDASAIRDNVVQYLTCDKAETSVDIIGLNTYRWCGNDDISSSGYNTITELFQNVPVPAYLSEFGCQKELPRLFTEVPAMFSDAMTTVWSGGVAFSYFKAQIPDFELVTLSGSNNETVTTNADFTRLQNAYASVTPPTRLLRAVLLNSLTLPAPRKRHLVGQQQLASYAPAIRLRLFDKHHLLAGGANCDAIAENGQTGTYGKYGFCDPVTKLNYVMSTYYQSQNRNVDACSFNNNATVNTGAPSSTSDIDQNASKCLAGFVPTSTPRQPWRILRWIWLKRWIERCSFDGSKRYVCWFRRILEQPP
ncbi:1,3-beta-glucanosyltransferase [Rhizoctonia solani]|uniref:1,3-beta-glucanosyltransferase n=1 Tax=Rhizoctonia solani TaxID=456999 RepID=A0A8H7M9F1_9AGAM|nr:1,3-beta-glucanosyltransferase [Rhizoctonia solani]